jgi:hypothetical protein
MQHNQYAGSRSEGQEIHHVHGIHSAASWSRSISPQVPATVQYPDPDQLVHKYPPLYSILIQID